MLNNFIITLNYYEKIVYIMIDMVFREAELSYASVSPDIIIRVIAKVLDRLIDINEQVTFNFFISFFQ